MKQVTAENERWEMKHAKRKMERLTAQVIGVSLHHIDDTFDTRSNVYTVDGK